MLPLIAATFRVQGVAAGAGADAGYAPRQKLHILPELTEILMKAKNTSHQFEEQVASMRVEVAKEQEMNAAELAKQKRIYEIALKRQQLLNEAIQASTNKTSDETKGLTAENDKFELSLRKLQKYNEELRTSLQKFQTHVEQAKLFVTDSLGVTDDHAAKELTILAPKNLPPTVDSFLKLAKSVKPSFLQFPVAVAGAVTDIGGPEVYALAKTIAAMSAATKEGAAKLKADFKAAWETGMDTQRALNVTRARALALKEEQVGRQNALIQAELKLKETNKELHERLDALRVFASSMGANLGYQNATDVQNATAEKLVRVLPNETIQSLVALIKPTAVAKAPAYGIASLQRQLAAQPQILARVRAAQAAKGAAPVGETQLAATKVAPAAGTTGFIARARARSEATAATAAAPAATASPARPASPAGAASSAARPISVVATLPGKPVVVPVAVNALRRPPASRPEASLAPQAPPQKRGWFSAFR